MGRDCISSIPSTPNHIGINRQGPVGTAAFGRGAKHRWWVGDLWTRVIPEPRPSLSFRSLTTRAVCLHKGYYTARRSSSKSEELHTHKVVVGWDGVCSMARLDRQTDGINPSIHPSPHPPPNPTHSTRATHGEYAQGGDVSTGCCIDEGRAGNTARRVLVVLPIRFLPLHSDIFLSPLPTRP